MHLNHKDSLSISPTDSSVGVKEAEIYVEVTEAGERHWVPDEKLILLCKGDNESVTKEVELSVEEIAVGEMWGVGAHR